MDQQAERDKNIESGFPDPETAKRMAINIAIGAIAGGLIGWYASYDPMWAMVGGCGGAILGWAFSIGKGAVFGSIVGAVICAWGAKYISGNETIIFAWATTGLLIGAMVGADFSEQKVKREITAEEAIITAALSIGHGASLCALFGIFIGVFIAGNYELTLNAILNGLWRLGDHIFIYEAAGAIAWAVLGAVFIWFASAKKHLAHIGFLGTVGVIAIGAIVGIVSAAIYSTAIVRLTCCDQYTIKAALLGIVFAAEIGAFAMIPVAKIRLKADSKDEYKKGVIAIIRKLLIGMAIGAIVGATLGAAIDWLGEEESKDVVTYAFLSSLFGAMIAIAKDLEKAKTKEPDRPSSEN